MSSTRTRQHIKAPRTRVCSVLIDPTAIAKWKVPTGMTCYVHAFDPREGGSFRISLTYDERTATGKTTAHTDTYHGRFVKLVPNKEVVEVDEFETADPALEGEMTITIKLIDADGGTDVLAVPEAPPEGAVHTMDYIIRKAETKDAPAIAKVHVETWRSHYRGLVPDDYLSGLSVEKRTRDWTESLSKPQPNEVTFVAEDGSTILGFCRLGPSRDPDASESTGELQSIYLLPQAHGQGIGSALMDEGLAFLKENGFKTATLWTLKTNASTIRFYEFKGWKPDGNEKTADRGNFTLEEARYRITLTQS